MWIVIIAVCIGNISSASASFVRRCSRKSDDINSDVIRKVLTAGCDSRSVAVLDVAFEGGDFECGVTSNRQATSRQPEVTLTTAQKDRKYTLLMVDPDAPGHSLQDLTFWLHWAVTDVKSAAQISLDPVDVSADKAFTSNYNTAYSSGTSLASKQVQSSQGTNAFT